MKKIDPQTLEKNIKGILESMGAEPDEIVYISPIHHEKVVFNGVQKRAASYFDVSYKSKSSVDVINKSRTNDLSRFIDRLFGNSNEPLKDDHIFSRTIYDGEILMYMLQTQEFNFKI